MAKAPTRRKSSSASPTDSRPAKSPASSSKGEQAKAAAPAVPAAANRTTGPTAAGSPGSGLAASPVPGLPLPAKGAKRFDIFIADVGWSSPVCKKFRENLQTWLNYHPSSTIYVLSNEQCLELFHNHPSMIGTEPSVIILDREARAAKRASGYGFKVNLGLIRDASSANNLLKWVLAVLAEQKPGSDITEPIRTVIHKEGLRGTIDILADIAHSPVGEAMTH